MSEAVSAVASNPQFSFISPRYVNAYIESVFPINLFIDGRKNDGQLDLDAAHGFLQYGLFPNDFFRANGTRDMEGVEKVSQAHPMQPGKNVGRVNSYTVDPTSGNFSTPCLVYENFVNKTVKGLYPNPTGKLRKALNTNLDFFFQGTNGSGCKQVFPYGRD